MQKTNLVSPLYCMAEFYHKFYLRINNPVPFFIIYTVCMLVMPAAQAQQALDRKEVRTKYGRISGLRSDKTVYSFKGIPYAQPPVGNLRWREPQPPVPWPEVKLTERFGPSPMQARPTPFGVYTPEFLIPESPISEDCLYLNVWTAATGTEKKPVFVWIYGGGFVSGGSACEIYDGTAMASKGIVFVSINYRVGIFGFFAHPELSKESPHKSSGNYGLMDQIAALKWVQENIAAFGGDPGNVTIAGQSAGSFSVNALAASPLAKGLFHKAIAESGSSTVADPKIKQVDLAMAEAEGLKLSQSINAFTLNDLRKLSADDLLKQRMTGLRPIADGYVLPSPVPELFKTGRHADIPLLTGWNADEAFISDYKNKDVYLADAGTKYGSEATQFLKFFPGGTDEEAKNSQIEVSRDLTFALGNYKWATIQSSKGKHQAYVYLFKRKPPATPDFVKYGAFHTAEVPYALGNLKYFKRALEEADHTLSELMLSYWVNFAKTGNPNGNGLPKWPAFREKEAEVMIFSEKSAAASMPGKEGLDFLYSQMMK